MNKKHYIILLLFFFIIENTNVHAQSSNCIVNVDDLLVREGPGRNHKALSKLKKNVKVEIKAMSNDVERINNLTGIWMKIISENGIEGWVFSPYIDCKEKIKKTGFPNYLIRTKFPFNLENKSFNLSIYCLGDTGGSLTNLKFGNDNNVVLHINTGMTVPSFDITKTGKYEVKGDVVKITWDHSKTIEKYFEKPEFNKTITDNNKKTEIFYMVQCISKKIGKKPFSNYNNCYGLFNSDYSMNEAEIMVLESSN